jgi:malonate transporter and related proteins
VASTIVSALLPVVVTLMLGYVAGWHRDFDGKHAAILNRMVMLYALPLNLFASMMGIPRHQILGQGSLAIAIFIGMVGTYAIVFVVTRFLCGRDLMSSSLQALAIGGPLRRSSACRCSARCSEQRARCRFRSRAW